MVSLIEALSRPNVGVNAEAVVPGSNTIVDTGIVPENWQVWQEFEYATLARIFRRELEGDYRGELEPNPLDNDLCICNEETFEDLLRRFISPVVNYALHRQAGSSHYGRGSRCGTAYKPDWSVISALRLDEHGSYVNVLPGDTKLDAKWWPGMVDDERNHGEWQKVVSQIVTYMACHYSRYGFIITDTCLVAFRITRRPVSPGLALGRSRREVSAASSHQRQTSDISMASGASSYSDDDPLRWDYYDPEYVTIPWSAHGRGRLTIKFALWCLAMMAVNGDNFIHDWYPALDSWRSGKKGYVYNTSGTQKAALSKHDRQQEPDIQRAIGETAGEVGGEPSGTEQVVAREDVGDDPSFLSPARPGEADVPHFSQASTSFGGSQIPGYADEEEEEEDDDSRTEVEAPIKRREVTIKKHKKRLYFLDAKGKEKDTTKEEWKKVDGGYELEGRKHIYFTKRFP